MIEAKIHENNNRCIPNRQDDSLEASSKGKNKNISCTYFKTGANPFFLFILLFLFLLAQSATSLTDYFVPHL